MFVCIVHTLESFIMRFTVIVPLASIEEKTDTVYEEIVECLLTMTQ